MNSGNTYTVLSLLGSLVLFVLILVLAWFWSGSLWHRTAACWWYGLGDRYCCWV